MLKKFAVDTSAFDRFALDRDRRTGIARFLRRAAVIALPAIGLSIFVGLLAWTIRRQLNSLGEGLVIEEDVFETPEPIAPA